MYNLLVGPCTGEEASEERDLNCILSGPKGHLSTLLSQLLDHWPWHQVNAAALVQYMTADRLPDCPLHYPPICNAKSHGLNTSIVCIDPETGKPSKWNAHADLRRAANMKIAAIPPNIINGTSKSKWVRDAGDFKTYPPDGVEV